MGAELYVHGLAAVYRCPTVGEIDRCLAALADHLRYCPAGSPHRRKITADADLLLDRRLTRSPAGPTPG
jgi:hypothetical protein